MFTFHIENHEPFGPLTKNCPKLDTNKSIVSSFSVFVVYKSAVSATQKRNYVGCLNFRQRIFVFAHLFPDISIKSTKLHFQSWKKIFTTISLFLRKMTAEVSRGSDRKAWFQVHSKLHDHNTKNKAINYVLEQLSFQLIALFWLKIGRCRGRIWAYGNQA